MSNIASGNNERLVEQVHEKQVNALSGGRCMSSELDSSDAWAVSWIAEMISIRIRSRVQMHRAEN
jgi:hypothetical protein